MMSRVLPNAVVGRAFALLTQPQTVTDTLPVNNYTNSLNLSCMVPAQTLSRVLPNSVVGRAFAEIGVENETLKADLPSMVELGLQKLYGYQHNDGGWGWWYDDTSNEYQTAYVLFGLAATGDAGFEVDPGVIERGATWLKDQLDDSSASSESMDPRTLRMCCTR